MDRDQGLGFGNNGSANPAGLKRASDVRSIKEVSAENDEEDDGVSNVARLQSASSQNTKLGQVKKFREYG